MAPLPHPHRARARAAHAALRELDLGENELGIEGTARLAAALPALSELRGLSLLSNQARHPTPVLPGSANGR